MYLLNTYHLLAGDVIKSGEIELDDLVAINNNYGEIISEENKQNLVKFDFNEDEQREAAKILMFPEDALYEYDASYKSGAQTSGKTITEVLMEAKKESKAETKENKKEEHIEINEDTPSLENIFESVMEKNDFSKETTEQTEEKTETPVEPDIKEEVKPLFSDSEEPKVVAPSKEERDNESNNNDVKTLLTKLGININSISEEKIKKE